MNKADERTIEQTHTTTAAAAANNNENNNNKNINKYNFMKDETFARDSGCVCVLLFYYYRFFVYFFDRAKFNRRTRANDNDRPTKWHRSKESEKHLRTVACVRVRE